MRTAILSSVLVLACVGIRDSGPQEEAELAPFMSQLQTFSQKLGYAIQAKNRPLADFYLHEIHEVAEEIGEEVPEHDGHQIAKLLKATIEPAIADLERKMKSGDWAARGKAYAQLMAGCNTCHHATAHGYIHVLPAKGTPPFNQRFTPEPAASTPK